MRLDRAAFLLASVLIVIYYGFYASCHSRNQPVERGHEPWVFRSVLDERPRMLTLALGKDFWIAYDAGKAALYKVWQDGVKFDGAVYTTAHGPQPTSIGDAYLISPDEMPWRLVENGRETLPRVQYRGHRYYGAQATLRYELIPESGQPITVEERPEYRHDDNGKPGLERTFTLSGVPKGTTVKLRVRLASLMSEADIQSTGPFEVIEKHVTVIPGTHLLDLDGVLSLNTDRETRLTVFFHPGPTLAAAGVEMEGERIPAGQALIQRSDCNSCHNERVKTVGPAYIDIAKRYPFTSFNVSKLAKKVIAGGAGVWGPVAMTAHPDLQQPDAETMMAYILGLDGETMQESSVKSESYPLVAEAPAGSQGVAVNIYQIGESLTGMPEVGPHTKPTYSGVVPAIHAMEPSDFGDFTTNFYVQFKGYLDIPRSTNYVFRLISDDGSVLRIDGKVVIDHDGFHGPDPKDSELILTAGKHPFSIDFFQAGGGRAISLQWAPYGADDFSVVPPAVFSHDAADVKTPETHLSQELARRFPGDSAALVDVHPSFDLRTIRPESFKPKVGGLDFLPDGRLVVSTWDPDGSVYLLEGIEREDREKIRVKRIASGLAEPLGLKVVDGEIYVLQKQELTRLIDHDGDDIIDEYRTLCSGWQASANFHEFAFGLVYQNGYFYATLATAINPGGASTQPQIHDRGRAIKISRETGDFEFIAQGLRTPNGIGVGVDNELFIADNQGDWLPASKILHLQPGAFYGSRSVDFAGTEGLAEMPPVVWLPQDEIGNSPSQPAWLNVGPYQGQMIHGEVTHGGIKRVFVEKVEGQYQGCLFRFTQGLEGGVNRLIWGPDGALYIGQVGNPGNWGHEGKYAYGLQQMRYNGQSTFEMLAVRAKTNGMEIEFTEALQEGNGLDPAGYFVQQWRYQPTADYGGPKLDLENLEIRTISRSEDRKRVLLELPGLKPGHVVYIRLKKRLVSAQNHEIWTTEAWYNLNRKP